DAVDRRSQWWFLARRLRAPVPPATHGSGVRLPGGQRGGTAPHLDVVAALDPSLHRAAQGAPRLRVWQLRGAPPGEPPRLRAPAHVRGGSGAVRPQHGALGAGGGARSLAVRGDGAGGDVRSY